MGNKLEIVGPYPPPLGGISVHIERMEWLLKAEKIQYTIFNHGSVSGPNIVATDKSPFWYIKYLFTNQGHVIHFHQFFKFHFFYYILFSHISNSKLIITIHNENILGYNAILRKIILSLLRATRFTLLISVSEKLSKMLLQNGIENLWLPAYVPPEKLEKVPLRRITGKEYFVYSIWKLDQHTALKVYNIELAFKVLTKIKGKYHMLFLIGTEAQSDKEYAARLVDKFQLSDSITIIYEKRLTDYLMNCKFLLRTNIVDGYGVSLQEAIDLKIPAIASDVCTRPKGTILFKNDNFEDLLEKVRNLEQYWNPLEGEKPTFHLELLQLYKRYLR